MLSRLTRKLLKPKLKLFAGFNLPLSNAVKILNNGGLVAFPTETVYGLGADATNSQAVASIYAAKGRPHFNPLISHVATLEAAFALGVFGVEARILAHKFWPGPMTLVVPALKNCPTCELARAGLNSIAIRVPSHPVAHELLRCFGKPIVAPSANLSGHVSPTTAQHVRDDMGEHIDLILDGGSTEFGLESTIFNCMGGVEILRPGSITRQLAEDALGLQLIKADKTNIIIAPGQLGSHYAPCAQMRLNVTCPQPHEAYLAFGEQPAMPTFAIENLSPKGDLTEAASNLYAMLRKLDQTGATTIAVSPIPAQGLGEAIMDRLMRAAAPRQ